MKSRTYVLSALLVVALTPAVLYACGRVDLSITKSGPGTATVGQTATYNFTVTQHDTGRSTGTQTEVRDLIPAGFTYASASGVNCSVSGNNVICTGIPNLTQNQSHSFSVTFNVTAASCANSPVTNTAVVDAREADTNPGNDTSNSVSTTINGCDADLSIIKSGDSTVAAGGTVQYTVQVTNGGPSDATNVVVTDPIPTGLTLNGGASDGACSQNGSNVECTASSLTNGANKSFAIAFDVPDTQQVCGTTISNQASVSSDTGDANTGNNTSSTVSTSVTCNADLSVTKTGPSTIEGGNTISYTITATNGGPNTAHNIKVTDAIPSGLTFNGGASDGACSQNGSNVECTASSLANGANKAFTVAFDVPASGALCGNSFNNQASVSSDTTDSNGSNNTSQSVTTQVTCSADLSITKSGPGTVTRNSTVSYTIIVTNNGPADAQGVTISDPVPAGVTFNSGASDASCVLNGANVLCNNITLTSGQSKTLTIAFTVPAGAVCNSTIANQATVSSSTTDPVSGNNTSSTVASTVDCSSEQADLSITKAGPASVARGATISYSLVATNNGPATANAVTITDPVPAGLTFNSGASDAGCALNGINVLCNSFSLTNGASKTVTVAFDVPSSATCGATIANQASVSASSIDPVSSNNTSQTVTSTVDCSGEQADLSITKSGPATVQQGNVLSYTVSVTNGGPAVANAVKVSDAIPSGLIFNSASSSPECTVNGSNIECTVSTLANGASKGFTIAFDVPNSTTCNATVTNVATVSSTSIDPVSSNNTSQTVSTSINCDNLADLSVTKSGPATITRNSVISYSVTATNNGPGTATSVVISDAVPTGLSFNSGASDLSCVQNGSNVQCNSFNLASGQSRTVTIAFNVPAGAPCGSTIANVANVASALTDPVSSNNTSQTVSTTVDCSNENADVRISKAGPNTVLKGGTISYTINVTNDGPATAQGITISDPVPSGLIFNPSASSPNCIVNGGNVLCNNIALVSGQTQNVTIAFDVPTSASCGAQYTNQATVSSSSTDPVSSNNTSNTVSTTVDCPPVHSDLEIVKAGRDRIPRTETLIYMIQVLNRGPDEAPDVEIRDTIPAGLVFNPGSSHPSCQQVGTEIVCNGPALPKDRQWPILIAFDLSASVQCGSFIQNRARVSTTAIDPNSSNDQSQLVATFVECPNGNMTIEKTGPTTVLRGNTITYNIVVRNTSPTEVLRNTLVFDQTPANTTFETTGSTPGCFIGTGFTDVFCPAEDIPVGGTRNVTLVFRVGNTAPCDSFINNIADVWADNADATWSNEVITQVQCLSTETDISVDKTGPGTVTRGNQISYSITVTNHGLGDATGVQIADPIPNGLTFVAGSSSSNCSVNGAEVVCGNIDLVNGQSRTLTLVFNVPTSVACNSTLQNQARLLSAPQGDPNPNNNLSNVISTTVDCPAQTADLRISKSGPASVVQGNTISYTLLATNDGPNTATNVTIADPIPTVPHATTGLPVQLTFLPGSSDASCVSNGTDILCNNFNLVSGQSKTLTVAFSVPTTARCASTIVNRASVSASSTDPNSSNNQSQQVSTAVDCIPTNADVSVTKSGPATVTRGNVLTYNLTASNAGPVNATNVTISDTVPTGLTFNAGASSSICSVSGNTVTCSIGSLASGASQSVTLGFNTPAALACNSTVQNVATVAALEPDPTTANNTSSTVSTTILCPVAHADVSATKSGPATVTQGNLLTYTVTATNNGPDTATNVSINDTVPTGLTFNPGGSGAGCSLVGNTVICSIGTLSSGASSSVTLSFNVPSTIACNATVQNFAIADLTEQDPNSTNNTTNIVTTTVLCPVAQADVAVTKTGPATILKGTKITYTLTATNFGPDAATNVVVTDPIPSAQHQNTNAPLPLQFEAGDSDQSCAVNGVNIECSGFSLNPGQSKSVQVTFTVPSQSRCSAFIVNQASVVSGANDPNGANNSSQIISTLIQCPVTDADLSITKVGQPTVLRGNRVSYNITVTNNGPATATNVTIADPIPTVLNEQAQGVYLTFDQVASDPTCAVNGINVLCNNFSLTAGQSKTVTLAFTVPTVASCNANIVNFATVSASSTDPISGNNTSQSVQTTVQCPVEQADLTIAKMGRDRIPIGETLLYTLQAFNRGPSTATNVTFRDQIPAGLVFNASQSDSSCQKVGNEIHCTRATLAESQLWTIVIGFDIDPQIAQCNSFLSNVATLSSDQTDPDPGTNTSNTVQTYVECPGGEISIVKTGPATALQGDTITYNILVTNNSAFTVQEASVFDGTPQNTTFVQSGSSPECYVAPGFTDVFCAPTDLAPGQQRSVTLVFKINDDAPCDSTLNNIADVWSDNADPTWSNEVVTQIMCPPASFSIAKTDNRTTVTAGEVLNYQISVTNTSTVNDSNVQVTDTLPANVTFVGASDGGVFDGTQVNWTGLSIDAGQTKVLMMTVSVNSGTPNGTILTNNVFVINGPTAIDQTTVIENIAFTISKDDGRTNANAGETLIYTIPVTNTSASNATNVTVEDTLPSQVTFVSADNSGTHSSGKVTWTGLAIPAGQTVNLMVTVTIKPATPGGTVLTNTATILGGPTAVDTTIVNGGQLGCIEIIKETFDTNGQPITPVAQFMFSMDNGAQTTQNDSNGHARFDNVSIGSHTITETVPATWTQLSVTPANGVVQVQSGPVCSTVTFKNQQQLQNPTFTITKTDNRTTVSPGETLIYTIDVTNTSAVNAASVSIRDTLPVDLTFVSTNNNGTHTAGVVDWVVPIAAGETVQFTVQTTVKASTANGTVLENTAQVLGGPSTTDTTTVVIITSSGCIDVVKETFDINGQLITPVPQFSFQLDGGAQSTVSNSLGLARFNNVPTGTHAVSETVPPTWRQVSITPPSGLVIVSQGPTCSTVLFKNQQDLGGPEFAMSKTDGRSTAAPGETLTYTVTVENISNKNATGVTVIDTLPTNVTFISADSSGVHSNGIITWSNISVNGNSSKTLTVIAQVNANVADGTIITNTAGIPNVITVTDTTTVSTQVPTFTISKTDNLSSATPGQSLTYLITVQNTSAFNATNVSVTDTLPSQVIYNGSSDNGSVNGQIVTWSGISIAAGQQKTLTVTAAINSSAQNGTVLTNTAQVVNGPSAIDTTTIQGGQPLLTISKTDNRTTAKVNEILTYVITLQNTTSASATNVGVTDTLPGDVTFVSATNGGTANGQTVTWGNLTVNGNSTISLTVQARVNSAVPDNTILTNTAQIVGGLSATDTTTVEGGTPDPNNVTIDLSDDRDPVDPGESFCYTIQVHNLNSAELTNQTVTQTLDGMTEFQSASDNGSHSSRIITWRNVTLPGNGTKTFNSCVKVDEDTELDELLTSKAFINSKSDTENTRVGEGFITGNNRCEIQSISDTPDPVKIGETLTYSIRVRNGRTNSSTSTTSSSARSFDIVAFLDNDTTFMSASNGGDENGGREVEWNDIRLRRGESESVRVTVRVKDTAARQDQLRIRVQCEDDEEYENTRVEDGDEPPTDGNVRVSIDKRASHQEARPGDMVTYTLTLRNLTNRAATDVTIEDRFNAGSISIQDSGGGEIAGNGIDWKVASLGPNDTRIFTYRIRVGPDMRHGQIISNTVAVRSPDLDRPATDTEEVRIITELPQTGGGGFGSSFTNVAENLRPTSKSIHISSSNGSAAMQFILWTSIISIGMLGGTVLGKRFFL